MTPWTPDVAIDDAIAEELLRTRFPQLSPLNLRLLGSGWDNHAYLVNESLVFRIPHRQMGAELMEIECVVLAYLNRQSLPLSIPDPQFVAPPDDRFPYKIAGYPLIEGSTADSVVWTDEERGRSAKLLAEFLAKLHRAPVEVPFALEDKLRRADLPFRLEKILAKIKSAPAGFCERLQDLASTPQCSKPAWVHGDLYSRHLIVDSAKTVCGVIDWGDTHVGDPALDIAIAWMFLPSDAWPDFVKGYGGVDEHTWRRAQFRTMCHWVYLQEYAETRADAALLRELEFVLKNVTQE